VTRSACERVHRSDQGGILRPTRVLTIAALASALGSCDSPTGPQERVYLSLGQFEMPTAVSATDTVRVAFRYSAWCGPTPAMALDLQQGRVGVAVWTTRGALDGVCPAIYPLSVRAEFLLPPQFLGTESTTVRFRQSEGVDSVRVIATRTTTVPPS
jgi:hypothetical protein